MAEGRPTTGGRGALPRCFLAGLFGKALEQGRAHGGRVLPLPVGVTSRPERPARPWRHTARWKNAGVQPRPSNQALS